MLSDRQSELLLCCARTEIDVATRKRITRLVTAGIEWDDLVHMALDHAVLPLLYQNLHDTRATALPASASEALERHFSANALCNLRLGAELLDLLGLFQARGLRAIPYKGPALAASAYGNLLLRQFGDLDLLVPESDVAGIKQALHERGYRVRGPGAARSAEVHLRSHREYQLVLPEDEILVELHWRVAAHWQLPTALPLDFEQLWERRRSTAVAGRSVQTLSPEDALLILCLHGTSHEWRRLQLVCDVAQQIHAHPEMDWTNILRRARHLRGERMLALGLALADELLGTVLPQPARALVAEDAVVASLTRQIRGWLFPTARKLGVFEEAVFHLRTRERLRDKVPYLPIYLSAVLGAVFTPTGRDRELVPLPPRLAFLYHILRPMRLLSERISRIVVGRR